MKEEAKGTLDLTMEKIAGSNMAYYTDQDLAIFSDLRRSEARASFSAKFLILLFCTKGSIQVDINSNNYMIKGNEILLCAPHTYINMTMVSQDFQGKLICISNRLIADSLHYGVDTLEKMLFLNSHPIVTFDNEHMKNCSLYFEMLHRKIKDTTIPYKQEIIRSLLRAAMYEFLSHIETSDRPGQAEELHASSQGDRLVRRFLKMLATDKVKPRFVIDYASRLCVTPKYLSAVCKSTTGKTASTWIDLFIVKEAKQLMLYSNKSIKEISQELGFPNLSFFGKYIKSQLGMSPTAYRTAAREKNGNKGTRK